MNKIRDYLLAVFVGVIFIFLLFLVRDTFSTRDNAKLMQDLTDAFFCAGVMVFCFGLFILINNNGFFDMIIYSFRKMYLNFKSEEDRRLKQSFFDYKQEKSDENIPFLHFLIVGAVYFIISIIFLVLYYS